MSEKIKVHKLNRNKRTTHPSLFVFVDTETYTYKIEDGKEYQKLFLGVCFLCKFNQDGTIARKSEHTFNTAEQFWYLVNQFVTSKQRVVVIAHNMNFDATILKYRTNLDKMGWSCSFYFDKGLTFISEWKKDNRTILLLDNANWFTGKLEKWGKTLGKPKLSMPDVDSPLEEWENYCKRDVEILYELSKWFIKWIIDNDMGNWRYTRAACSFNSYRHRFMDYSIWIPDNEQENKLARKAYKGGRTEVFRVGAYENQKFYKLDINSMYPDVMYDFSYPVSLERVGSNPDISGLSRYIKSHGIIAEVTLNVDIPYFVYHNGKRNIYPTGIFTTYLTTPEILLAFANNWIVSIGDYSIYRMRPIFRKFVDELYSQRLKWKQQGNELMSTFFKLYLNSLYGKFGQLGYNTEVIGQAEPGTHTIEYGYDATSDERFTISQIGQNVIKTTKTGKSYNSFPAIAAHVTAYARLRLYDLILLVGRKHVYYSDTDSIICDEVGYNKVKHLIHPTNLGALKVEGVSDYIQVVAPKHYTFGDKTTLKGIRKDAIELGKFLYQQTTFPGTSSILKSGVEEYYIYQTTKQLSPRIETGTINSEGYVLPYHIEEYEQMKLDI